MFLVAHPILPFFVRKPLGSRWLLYDTFHPCDLFDRPHIPWGAANMKEGIKY
jgi:hypothetical protein